MDILFIADTSLIELIHVQSFVILNSTIKNVYTSLSTFLAMQTTIFVSIPYNECLIYTN